MTNPHLDQSADISNDFIFGTLATDALRIAAMKAQRRGVYHGNRTTPLDPQPGEAVTVHVITGPDINASRVIATYTSTHASAANTEGVIELRPTEVFWDTLTWSYVQEWEGSLPGLPIGTTVEYRIVAETYDGRRVWADPKPLSGEPATFAYHVDDFAAPDWIHHAVIYQILVDRFAPTAGQSWNAARSLTERWGGTLRGIRERLPYLQNLGITCLWLSPVMASPTYHGYDATDLFHVEPALGTDEEFDALCEAAHALGIRILVDFVANHISSAHPAFQRAITDPASPERDWFTFSSWPTDYDSFFGVREMPRLNTDHPDVRRELLRAANHWLERGADGFRLDYANGPSHAFWAHFRAGTRATKADALSLGEVVETAKLQRSYQGRLDGTLDFLLMQQMRRFFAFETTTAAELETFLERHTRYFSTDFVLPSFLDNHDMNRFLWVARGDERRLKLAAMYQFTLPGPPIIYYGTEVGLSQERDVRYPDGTGHPDEARLPMRWGMDQNRELLDFYRRLIAFRRANAGRWRATRRLLRANEEGLLVVQIGDDSSSAIVALNRTATEERVPVPSDIELAFASDAEVRESFGAIVLPPYVGAILTRG